MQYINTETHGVVPHEVLLAMHPNTSFPPPGPEFVPPEPFVLVLPSDKPAYIPHLQQVVPGDPVQVDGVWVQGWKVIEIFDTEAERFAATAAAFDVALTNHLDATARTKHYDNRITCMVRAGFAGPFQTEGQAFAMWADACNAFAYQLMADVAAGAEPMPPNTEAFIAMLPAMVWPE